MDAFKIDPLKLYFGEPFVINDKLLVRQPTLGEIIEFGADKYYSVLNALTISPEKMISPLWDMGVDWETISEFDLFIRMTRGLTSEDTKIFFGENVDLSLMIPCKNPLNNTICLAEAETEEFIDNNGKLQKKMVLDSSENVIIKQDGLVIDELIHAQIAAYIRCMHNITVQKKRAKNARTKKIMIMMDRDERAVAARENHGDFSESMLNMISFALNCPGFKYKKNELKECGIVEFNDSIQRLNIIFQTDACLKGIYSGMVSAKDILKGNKEALNYMRSINQVENINYETDKTDNKSK